MYRMHKAYLLKDKGHVVTNKSMVMNAGDEEFEEVTICIPLSLVKEWAQEVDMLGLEEE